MHFISTWKHWCKPRLQNNWCRWFMLVILNLILIYLIFHNFEIKVNKWNALEWTKKRKKNYFRIHTLKKNILCNFKILLNQIVSFQVGSLYALSLSLDTCIASDMKAATFPEVPKLMISWTSLTYFSPSEPKRPR